MGRLILNTQTDGARDLRELLMTFQAREKPNSSLIVSQYRMNIQNQSKMCQFGLIDWKDLRPDIWDLRNLHNYRLFSSPTHYNQTQILMIGWDFKKINKSQPLRHAGLQLKKPLTISLTLSLIRNVRLISAYHCCWIKDVIVCWCQTQRKWPGPVCVSHWQTVPHTGGRGQPRGTDRSSDLPVCVCACVRRMRGEKRPILSVIARCKAACLQWHKVSLHTVLHLHITVHSVWSWLW